MSVRAKFKVSRIERSMGTAPGPKREDGSSQWVPAEFHTVHLNPVYGNGNENHENTKFWNATPQGSIMLGMVNLKAGVYFELGQEYYVDFTKASVPPGPSPVPRSAGDNEVG